MMAEVNLGWAMRCGAAAAPPAGWSTPNTPAAATPDLNQHSWPALTPDICPELLAYEWSCRIPIAINRSDSCGGWLGGGSQSANRCRRSIQGVSASGGNRAVLLLAKINPIEYSYTMRTMLEPGNLGSAPAFVRTSIRRLPIFIPLLCASLWMQSATLAGMTQDRQLHFSQQPTVSEILDARVFDEPLIPIVGEPRAEESKALADALAGYSCRTNLDDFSSLTGFLAGFPQSAWAGSLLLHLGTEYYNYGHYSKAMDAWEQAWKKCEQIDDAKAKSQADRALGELARMYSKLGRVQGLKDLLNSTANRPLTGPGTQLIHAAQQALWMMQNRPEISFRCGPLALNSILAHSDPKKALNPLIFYSKSSTNGYSMAQVARLSWDLGLNYQIDRKSG